VAFVTLLAGAASTEDELLAFAAQRVDEAPARRRGRPSSTHADDQRGQDLQARASRARGERPVVRDSCARHAARSACVDASNAESRAAE
jgi:hypothetical protein